MRKYLLIVVALLVTAAGCGDDDAAAVDPASVTNCEELADATIQLTQDVINMMGDMTPEEIAAAGSSDPPPDVISVEERGAAIGIRAEELGCTTLTEMVTERADRLEAEPDNAMGQLIILGVRNGDDVMEQLSRGR